MILEKSIGGGFRRRWARVLGMTGMPEPANMDALEGSLSAGPIDAGDGIRSRSTGAPPRFGGTLNMGGGSDMAGPLKGGIFSVFVARDSRLHKGLQRVPDLSTGPWKEVGTPSLADPNSRLGVQSLE